MQQPEHGSRLELPQSQALCERLDPFVRRYFNRWRGRLPSDVLADWRQEADLLLWQLTATLQTFPEEDRERYACTCTQRLVRYCLQREQQQRVATVAFEDLSLRDKQRLEKGEGTFAVEDQFFAEYWLESVEIPALAAAIRELPVHDYLILDMSHAQGLTNAEIAAWMGVTAWAVAKQRHRILAKMCQSVGTSLWSVAS